MGILKTPRLPREGELRAWEGFQPARGTRERPHGATADMPDRAPAVLPALRRSLLRRPGLGPALRVVRSSLHGGRPGILRDHHLQGREEVDHGQQGAQQEHVLEAEGVPDESAHQRRRDREDVVDGHGGRQGGWMWPGSLAIFFM